VNITCGSCNSSVDKVTTLQRVRPEQPARFPAEARGFRYTASSRPGLRSTQPLIQWVPGVKRQEHETDRLPASSAEIKDALELYVSPSIRLHMKYRMLYTGDG
jgi:hypothetical protein